MHVNGAKINLPRLSPLDENTTKALIRRSQAGDPAAREKLVKHNLRLVYSVALRLHRPGVELEDLFQVGCVGLVKAIDHFDLGYEVRFSTYAVPVIAGEIKRLIRDDGLVKVGRSMKRLGQQLAAAREKLVAELSREPTMHELASHLDIPVEEAVQALEALAPMSSLQEPLSSSDSSLEVQDTVGSVEDPASAVVDSVSLKKAIQQLPERERKILLMRYFQERTQAEVAELIGVSQVQVSRIEKRVLAALKEAIQQ